MVDTVRTITQLIAAMPSTIGAVSAQDIRDMLVTLAPKCAELHDESSQPIASPNVSQVIDFDSAEILEGFSHSGGVITANEEMQFVEFTLALEVDNGAGSNIFSVWMEIDTGSGFNPITDSGEQILLSPNTEEVLTLGRIIENVSTGDDFRFRCQGTSTNLTLSFHDVNGDIPMIPSVHLSVMKL